MTHDPHPLNIFVGGVISAPVQWRGTTVWLHYILHSGSAYYWSSDSPHPLVVDHSTTVIGEIPHAILAELEGDHA